MPPSRPRLLRHCSADDAGAADGSGQTGKRACPAAGCSRSMGSDSRTIQIQPAPRIRRRCPVQGAPSGFRQRPRRYGEGAGCGRCAALLHCMRVRLRSVRIHARGERLGLCPGCLVSFAQDRQNNTGSHKNARTRRGSSHDTGAYTKVRTGASRPCPMAGKRRTDETISGGNERFLQGP